MKDNYEIIKKTIGHDNIKFKDGKILIWNSPSIITTLNSFILLQEICMKEFGNRFKDILYYIIRQQTKEGTKILHKQYGFKNIKKALDLELQTASMIGFGICTLIKYNKDKKHAIVKIYPNPVSEMHKKIMGISKEPIDHYSRGALSGIFSYVFGEDIVAIEAKCEARGDPHCIFELKPRKEWDLKDPLVKAQFPEEESKFEDILKNFTIETMRDKNN